MKRTHCDLIVAWALGAEIEREHCNNNHPEHPEWVTESNPVWRNDLVYRIKGGQTPIIARNSGLTSGTLVATTTTIPVIDPILNLEDIKWV